MYRRVLDPYIASNASGVGAAEVVFVMRADGTFLPEVGDPAQRACSDSRARRAQRNVWRSESQTGGTRVSLLHIVDFSDQGPYTVRLHVDRA
jgi:hypothetical protein